jgi:hypothetical protein
LNAGGEAAIGIEEAKNSVASALLKPSEAELQIVALDPGGAPAK